MTKIKIKCKRYSVDDPIESDLTVSSIFQPIYHIRKPEQLVDVFMDNITRSDMIASLEDKYCSHIYNCHNIHKKIILFGMIMLILILMLLTFVGVIDL